jgi:putative ABC transport system permease protein
MFVEQSQVEKMFDRPPSFNDISVLLTKGANRKEVIKKAEKVLEPYQVIETVTKENFPSNFQIHEEVRQNEEFGSMIAFLILFISSVALYITLSRLVQSQRGEIGLSKALGYRDWQILLHYLIFSVFIAFAGSIVGSGLGQYFGKLINQMYIQMLNIPILKHQIYPEVIGGAVMMSGIFCILAGFIPAFGSARMLPARAMRFDPGVALSKGKIPIIERIFGWIMPSSFTFRIPLRNIFRLRRRSVYTIIGIAFAMILTVVGISINDSTNYLLDAQEKTEKWDIFAVFGQDFSSKQVDEVKGFGGVKKVQAVLMVPAKLEANGKKHEGPVTAIEPDADFHSFDIAEGDKPEEALKDNGLILPQTLADKLDVGLGDELKVKTPYIKKTLNMQVKAISDELWGSTIVTGLEQGQRLIDSQKVMYNGLYLNTQKTKAAEIRDRLYELPGAYIVQKKEAAVEYIKSVMGLVLVFVGVVLAFAFMMAFVVIYNTFTANVIERTREVATMMTIGEDRRHLAVMITLENIALAVVGIPIGIALGIAANTSMYESLSTEAYSLPAVVYPISYVIIIASILVVLMLSEIPPIRRIFRMDLAEATKAIE